MISSWILDNITSNSWLQILVTAYSDALNLHGVSVD